MNKEDKRMFYKVLGNSIQENKDKIEKLEKQNTNYKKAKKKLQQENKQLKDNWNELKKIIEEQIENPLSIEFKMFSKMVLRDMQELEKGESNE